MRPPGDARDHPLLGTEGIASVASAREPHPLQQAMRPPARTSASAATSRASAATSWTDSARATNRSPASAAAATAAPATFA